MQEQCRDGASGRSALRHHRRGRPRQRRQQFRRGQADHRMPPVRRHLRQRLQDEAPQMRPRVRQHRVGRGRRAHQPTDGDQVEVEAARRIREGPGAPGRRLDGMQRGQQPGRVAGVTLQSRDAVDEVRRARQWRLRWRADPAGEPGDAQPRQRLQRIRRVAEGGQGRRPVGRRQIGSQRDQDRAAMRRNPAARRVFPLPNRPVLPIM